MLPHKGCRRSIVCRHAEQLASSGVVSADSRHGAWLQLLLSVWFPANSALPGLRNAAPRSLHPCMSRATVAAAGSTCSRKQTSAPTSAQLSQHGWPPPAGPAPAELPQAPANHRRWATALSSTQAHQPAVKLWHTLPLNTITTHATAHRPTRTRMPLGCTASEAPRGRSVDRSNTATRRPGLRGETRCRRVVNQD